MHVIKIKYNIKFTNINFYPGFLGQANPKPQGFIKQVTPNCRVFGRTPNHNQKNDRTITVRLQQTITDYIIVCR